MNWKVDYIYCFKLKPEEFKTFKQWSKRPPGSLMSHRRRCDLDWNGLVKFMGKINVVEKNNH